MIERLLRKLELRDPLHADERQALAAVFGPPRQVAAGEEIVLQGSEPKDSTLLLQGLTARSSHLASGSRQITALHIAGDFVDLHSMLLKRMDHSVVALTDSLVTSVLHADLRPLTDQFPHLTRMLWLNTLLDSAIHRRWLVAMGRQRSVGHLAHLICEHCLRLQVVGLSDGATFDFPISQAQLADALGLSPVHVNRSLQQLRSERLVVWSRKRVRILDWDRLAALAEFDPTYLQLEPRPV